MDTSSDPIYRRLAESLDALPNGFPATRDGSEIRLLAALFTPAEAGLAAALSASPEPPAAIAQRCGSELIETQRLLKGMTRRGLITCRRGEQGLVYGLMPFVVGIYEMQVGRIDAELARLFEDYYQQAFGKLLSVTPQVHRVIPVQEAIRVDLEIAPYESVSSILDQARAWGVVDCICRKQKALLGDPCGHPLDVCLVLGENPGMFDASPTVQALNRDEAQATLTRAAAAGLVHSVSNNQQGLWYICNCCTCSCGILRGMAEMGIANVVAHSAFVNHVDEARCGGCQACLEACAFNALEFDLTARVNEIRCVGCGVCVAACPEEALSLIYRPADRLRPPPVTETDWGRERLLARHFLT